LVRNAVQRDPQTEPLVGEQYIDADLGQVVGWQKS